MNKQPITATKKSGISDFRFSDMRIEAMSEQRERTRSLWRGFRILADTWPQLQSDLVTVIAGFFTELQSEKIIQGFWYMRKSDGGPHLRVRIELTKWTQEKDLLDKIASFKKRYPHLNWSNNIYEPETLVFGGAKSIDVLHKLFQADTDFYLAWQRDLITDGTAQIGPMELSIIAISQLFKACGFGVTESWDVWMQVVHYRPGPKESLLKTFQSNQKRIQRLWKQGDSMIHLLPDPSQASWQNFTRELERTGLQLRSLAAHGEMERGLRKVMVWVIIFLWNRWGLSPAEQVAISNMLSFELEP